jgi:hypothetical protein
MLQVLVVISQKFVAERGMGLCKSYSWKKELRKNGQVSKISKTMGT